MSTTTSGVLSDRHEPLWKRLPIVAHVRRSVGLQRGMLVAGIVICVAFIVLAVFAPLIAPYGYGQLSDDAGTFARQAAPSAQHLWGTTVGGYDVFSRVVWGTRTAISVVVVAVVLSIVLGVVLGLVSGYLGGWVDRVLVVVADAVYAFPSLLLAIVVSIVISGGQSSLWGGILSAGISITVVFVPQYFRVVRAEAVRLKSEAFVESAKVVGSSTPRIMFKHVLRNATRSLPLILTLLPMLGSGFVPTASMPGWLQWFAQYQPFTPFIETARGLLLGTPLGWNPLLAAGWAIVIAIGGYAWSMAIYERKSVR